MDSLTLTQLCPRQHLSPLADSADLHQHHRRRIYTGEKAKVVAADWGTELFQFLAALAILHLDDLVNRMISS